MGSDNEKKQNINWGGGDSSSSSDEVAFYPGKSYCCGLIHTGDSICKNVTKVCVVFVLIPLVLYWLWKSGKGEKLLEGAQKLLGGSCECCKKMCEVVNQKLNNGCINKLCNTESCRNCCGLQTGCENCCTCLAGCCKKGCLSDVCSWIKSCGGLKGCCRDCLNCCKNGLSCDACGKFCKGCLSCNFSKLDCCDGGKGCGNPMRCCGKCPCCSGCKEMDTCVCCEKPGYVGRSGGGGSSGGDGGCDCCARCCGACRRPSRTSGLSRLPGRNPSNDGVYRSRGRYTTKRKRDYKNYIDI